MKTVFERGPPVWDARTRFPTFRRDHIQPEGELCMVNRSDDPEAALAQRIFLDAVENVPPNDREKFVQDSCGGNSSLKSRVDDLLAAHQVVADYFDKPSTIVASIAEERPAADLEGSVIGDYKLLKQIGRGGMGVVYIAQQSKPVIRRVALKIVKPGMDTKQVIARFEMERQALAMMDHPHIAHVYDAGETESGLPYFVMELVQGKPITAYCDEAQLSSRERLRLFINVCQAVQHAHQKGIIHRDIKPSNVLVTLQDGKPVPKIIDFGVAKAINQEITDETMHTLYAQMIGTPLYMSPEQADLGGSDVDTRTDIYSLGVLLYEMLTGTTPFDRRALYDAGYDEMRRMIREDEPPRPSNRISTLAGDAATVVTDRRKTDRKRLRQTLSGDLDWIVVRALEKDRARRYQTASEFASDVGRFLNDEPVVARPPSRTYRIRKFARRHRAFLGSAAAIACILILGITVSTWQALEMARAWQLAEERSETAEWQRNRAEAANARAERLLYVSDMKVASDALRRDDIPLAGQLLDRHRPRTRDQDLRGFEWRYMHRLVDVPSHAELTCPDVIFCVNPSPDGRLLAAACDDGNIYIFDVPSRKMLRTIPTGAESANFVGWSSDQSEIATADGNGNLKTWDAADGSEKLSIPAHAGEAFCAHYTPNDGALISSGSDEMIYMWDRASGKKIRTFAGHERDAEQIAVSPDGRQFASASSDGTLRLWDVETGKELKKWDLEDSRVLCAAFSADGRHIAAGTVHGGVFLAETKSRTCRRIATQIDGIESVTFLPDGDWLATGDRGGTIHLWPVITDDRKPPATAERKIAPSWSGHTDHRVHALAVVPGSRLLISGGSDRVARMWTPSPQSAQWRIASDGQNAMGIAMGQNNQLYVADRQILCWNLSSRKSSPLFSTHQEQFRSLATSRNCCGLAASDDRTLMLFDTELQQLVCSWDIPAELDDPRLAVSPDGRKVATAWWDTSNHVEVYDADRPQQVLRLPATQSNCALFSPDGQRLAYGTMNDLKIVDLEKIGDVEQDEPGLQLSGHSSTLSDCAFHPSGDYIATVSHDRRLKLWNAHSGEELFSVIAHRDKIKTVAFSPDGDRLVTAGNDSIVKIWDRQSGQPLFDFGTESTGIRIVMFTPDGERLVCLLADGTIVVYDISTPASADS